MRKRVLCIALLSVLVAGTFAGSAWAGDFYQLSDLKISKSTLTAPKYQVYDISTVKLTATVQHATEETSGYNNTGTITWGTLYNPTDMVDDTNKLALSSTSTTLKSDTKTYTVDLTGKVLKPGTVTITATQGANVKSVTLSISIPERPAPTIPSDSFTKGKAGSTYATKEIVLKNYPKYVTVKVGGKTIVSVGNAATNTGNYDNLKVVIENKNIEDSSTTEATERKVTFGNNSDKLNFATGSNGVEIEIISSNDKKFSSGVNITSRTYTLKVDGIKPEKFTTKPTKNDLGEVLSPTKKVIETGGALTDTNQNALKFEVTTATLPVTITAKGLPTGLVISQSAGLDATKNSDGAGTATAVIKGTPTRAGTYNITVKATNMAGSCESKDLTLTVLDKPSFTTTTLPDLTWGKSYNTTLKGKGGITGFPISFDLAAAELKKLPKGLSFDKKNGVLKGTCTSPDSTTTGEFAFGSAGEKTVNVTFKIGNALAIVSKSFDIKVKSVKPTFYNQGTIQKGLDDKKLSFDHSFTYIISADGPGKMSWDIPKLPEGVKSASIAAGTGKTVMGVRLTGKPAVTMKNETAKISVYNGAGSTSLNLKFNVTYPSVDITVPNDLKTAKTMSADKTKTVSFDFTAKPGPIVWKAKGLPAGLKLSIDKSVSYDRKVKVVGELKSATKLDKDGKSPFYITAKNKVTGVEKTVSVDLRVYELPKITTSSLPALTTGKNYSGKLKGTGSTVSKDMNWTIKAKVSGDTAEAAALPFTSTTGGSGTGATGTAQLKVEYDKKTGDPTIVGSLDRVPTDGALLVHVDLATSGGKTSKDFVIKVKGVAPKFQTATLPTFTVTSNSNKVVVTGTQPITIKAYIDVNAVKKFFNPDGDTSIDLTATNVDVAKTGGFKFTDDANKKGEGNLAFTAGNGSFKGLPITFSATNSATAKPVVKVIKVNVKGKGIEFVQDSKKVSPDITLFVAAGGTVNQVFTLSGDTTPVELTTSLGEKGKNGLTASISDNAHTITIGGAPESGKETKTPITITAKNLSTNEKAIVKLTVIGMTKPVITTKTQTKEIMVGKSFNLKLQAKGSKSPVSKATKKAASNKKYATRDIQYNPISWDIVSGTGTKTLDDIKKLGLSFDKATGTFKGTPMTTTSADGAYTPYTFTVKAGNAAGDSEETVDITIGVKGRKIKFNNNAIVINKGGSAFLTSQDNMLKTDIAADDPTGHVVFTWADQGYDAYGFNETITRAGGGANNYGQLSGTFTNIDATRGASLKIQAENMGTTIKGTVKVVINDAAPKIAGDTTMTINAESSAVVTETMDFSLTDSNSMLTGATKIKWTLSKRSTNAKLNVTLKAESDGSGATATLKVQKMTSRDEAVQAKFSVTAQNTITKATDTKEVTVTINPPSASALPANKDALPEDKKSDEAIEEVAETETETEAEEETAEGTVSYGEARTEDWLTADERAAIAEAGYVIAAVLPEITADADGQYDLDAVTLSENAPAGESLVWFAFPRNAEKSDDDTIAEFYDEAGAEITAVPESRNVIASPWLREGVTYAPVIAVKAPVTSDTKDSLDEAEEGDTVTLEALEEAAENASEDEAPAEE